MRIPPNLDNFHGKEKQTIEEMIYRSQLKFNHGYLGSEK